MKSNKIALSLSAAIGVFAASTLVTRSADTGKPASNAVNITWIGSVVSGVKHSDVIGGPFPKADPSIEIGLREDGFVVWRKR